MKVQTIFFLFISLSFHAFGSVGHDETLDEDECWDARHDFIDGGGLCFVVVSAVLNEDDRLKVVYKNTCSNRIYAGFCNARQSGSDDCGSSSVLPGNTKTWTT